MKSKINSFLIIALSVILTVGCKKSNTSSNSTNGISTIKYEVITSSPIVSGPTGYPSIAYSNSTSQVELDNSFTSGTIWSKTFTTSLSNFQGVLQQMSLIWMSQPGTVKNTIYVNGVVKATQTLTTSPGANGFHGVGGVVMYIIP